MDTDAVTSAYDCGAVCGGRMDGWSVMDMGGQCFPAGFAESGAGGLVAGVKPSSREREIAWSARGDRDSGDSASALPRNDARAGLHRDDRSADDRCVCVRAGVVRQAVDGEADGDVPGPGSDRSFSITISAQRWRLGRLLFRPVAAMGKIVRRTGEDCQSAGRHSGHSGGCDTRIELAQFSRCNSGRRRARRPDPRF